MRHLIPITATGVVALLISRLHYFSNDIEVLSLLTFDARFWFAIQNIMNNTDLLNSDSVTNARFSYRFISDIGLQKFVIWLSVISSSNLLHVNLVVTTVLQILACIHFYFLGFFVFKLRIYSVIYALVVSQSIYFSWLRYPTLVPKMVGFALMPLFMLLFIRLFDDQKHIYTTILISIFVITLYPLSAFYYIPAYLFCGAIIILVSYRMGNVSISHVASYFWLSIAIVTYFLLISYFKGSASATPINVVELGYRNHQFDIMTLKGYWLKYKLYILSAASLFIINASLGIKDTFNTKVLLIGGANILILLMAILGHYLSTEISLFRVSWYWRASYYIIPGLLLFIMYQSIILARQLPCIINHPVVSQKTVSIVLVSFMLTFISYKIIDSTPIRSNNIKGAYLLWTGKPLDGDIIHERSEYTGAVNFINSTIKSSTFLLPYADKQNAATDMMSVYAKRVLLLSRLDFALLIVEHPETNAYYKALLRYRDIDRIARNDNYTKRVVEFSREHSANYIIQPAARGHKPELPVAYEDKYWRIYQTMQ